MSLTTYNLFDKWILDNGANIYMVRNLALLHDYQLENISHVQIANNKVVIVIGQGLAHITFKSRTCVICAWLCFKLHFYEI